MPIHYYHDVPIEENIVIVYNDQNNTFSEVLIDIHILEIYITLKVVSIHSHGVVTNWNSIKNYYNLYFVFLFLFTSYY